ncbi:hypothetical protein GF345_01850 [Candidatus Woesearchaeota archaeon]|nr:hypothetical protein [Candidatus Woesearchaeota archaeon]
MAKIKLPKPRLSTIPANPFKRALAFLIDMLILDLVVFFPFRFLITRAFPDITITSLNSLVSNPDLTGLFSTIAVSMGIMAILYFSLLEYRIGQTIGKMILRISVESEVKTGSYWQYLLRSIFLIPIFPLMILFIADIAYMFFNQKRQRLLEVISKTRTTEKIEEGWT